MAHSSLAPIEKVFFGQVSIFVRSAVGFDPAEAVLQALAWSVSEYWPSVLQSVHSEVDPPMEASPLRQSPHWVSVVGVQVLIK